MAYRNPLSGSWSGSVGEKPVKKDVIDKLKEMAKIISEMEIEEFIKRLDSVDVGDTEVYAKIERIVEDAKNGQVTLPRL